MFNHTCFCCQTEISSHQCYRSGLKYNHNKHADSYTSSGLPILYLLHYLTYYSNQYWLVMYNRSLHHGHLSCTTYRIRVYHSSEYFIESRTLLTVWIKSLWVESSEYEFYDIHSDIIPFLCILGKLINGIKGGYYYRSYLDASCLSQTDLWWLNSTRATYFYE